MMNRYSIIDEPKQHQLNALILSPVVILFASILIPMFITLPYFGRIWIPAVWLIFNSLLLKSASRFKEISVSILAVFLWFLIVYGGADFIYTYTEPGGLTKAAPYLRICSQAAFYFCLMYVVALQSTSYSLYEYISKRQ
jgi:hypothetical protein